MDEDHGLLDAGHGREDGLHLGGFDALAVDLDLVVGAADEVQAAVGPAAHQVAGAVHPGSGRTVGVGDEPFGGGAGPVEIAARELDAREVQLTGDAVRHRSQGRIEDVGAGVVGGCADGDGLAGHTGVGGGGDRELGGAV
ncbi:hypothetical protein PV517_32465 [Streptomyces griseiscabiei]|uniref:Uncharacterized protein n=1 Tax=Streptomyces griseiscabiei TaxID=2993540 RepID=A0ABU4LCB9_9ACTN|nr:hypothetical protein [Streptomyces griseiscabiei]MBZ3901137.1 hypothetical protein [Streptomyces griseiscabiei]MDX2913369.1 hypothetical protein [Streptomyces griseiscabiei]